MQICLTKTRLYGGNHSHTIEKALIKRNHLLSKNIIPDITYKIVWGVISMGVVIGKNISDDIGDTVMESWQMKHCARLVPYWTKHAMDLSDPIFCFLIDASRSKWPHLIWLSQRHQWAFIDNYLIALCYAVGLNATVVHTKKQRQKLKRSFYSFGVFMSQGLLYIKRIIARPILSINDMWIKLTHTLISVLSRKSIGEPS